MNRNESWLVYLESDNRRHSSWITHDDVIKWKHFSRYWTFVCGIHRLANSPHRGQLRGALIFSLIWRKVELTIETSVIWPHCVHNHVIIMKRHSIWITVIEIETHRRHLLLKYVHDSRCLMKPVFQDANIDKTHCIVKYAVVIHAWEKYSRKIVLGQIHQRFWYVYPLDLFHPRSRDV